MEGQTPSIVDPGLGIPTRDAIFNSVGADPLSAIEASMQNQHKEQVVVTAPPTPAAPVESVATPMTPPPTAQVPQVKPIIDPTIPPEAQSAEDGQEPTVEELLSSTGETKKPIGPQESIKALSKKSSALEKELEAATQELAAHKERLQKIEAGEELPEPIKQKIDTFQEQIEKLKPYEELHNLKGSEEYQNKYIAPLAALEAEAGRLAKDYGVDASIFNEALDAETKKERNRILGEHFDAPSALKAIQILDQVEALQNERLAAEQKPKESYAALRREHELKIAKQEQQRLDSISNIATKGVENAMAKVQKSKHPELSFSGNPEQDKYAKEIIKTATSNFSTVMKALALNGVKDIPEEVATTMAEAFLYGHAASVAMASRNAHWEEAQKIKQSASRDEGYYRPNIGGGSPFGFGGGQGALQGPNSGEDAADALLNHIGVKSR